MESLQKTTKEKHLRRVRSFPPLRFKKFQMKLDDSGAQVLIAANFLKKGNHSVRVHNGMLHLKIKQPERIFDYTDKGTPLTRHKKDMDFQIALPNKRYRHINTIRFHNGILKVHLTGEQKERDIMKFSKPAPTSNRIAAS
ncbi:hypothetical protein HZY62_12635 [Maribacter polysiphoniae]|uniref:Hsp20/alpha crystallin family protein n=1 Tax=Maribacter polysiphoniae TaxID=429344 RepID=A0A316DZC8_9FLAO|nr:hypothetical protein [Maribacter polysiphoniae]MBD1261443.1 hypothetical protein [Maribacter polysiphoniae]PWK22778.1 hypothetical protein LX92_02715 [Maribacter polysiphoniae]